MDARLCVRVGVGCVGKKTCEALWQVRADFNHVLNKRYLYMCLSAVFFSTFEFVSQMDAVIVCIYQMDFVELAS